MLLCQAISNNDNKQELDYIADYNSEDKYAVLKHAAYVLLFFNSVPTNEEIATFNHLIYDYYNKYAELIVYNVKSNSRH